MKERQRWDHKDKPVNMYIIYNTLYFEELLEFSDTIFIFCKIEHFIDFIKHADAFCSQIILVLIFQLPICVYNFLLCLLKHG